MGKRGPAPKPQSVKALEGTYRKDRDPTGGRSSLAASVVGAVPEPPPGLPLEAAAVWRAVAPELLRIGALQAVDLTLLSGYCGLRARAQTLDDIAAAEPLVEGKTGLKANPAGVEARKLWPLVKSLASDLGLGYASRARSGAPQTPQDAAAKERREAVDKFLFERQPFSVIEGGKREADKAG